MKDNALKVFRDRAEANDFDEFREMFASDVTLHSPTSESPQYGIPMTTLCVRAAMGLLHEESFKIVRTFEAENSGVVEFEATIDGQPINGADFLRWNADGKIDEFKVMVRPREAANLFCDKMLAKVASLIRTGQL